MDGGYSDASDARCDAESVCHHSIFKEIDGNSFSCVGDEKG